MQTITYTFANNRFQDVSCDRNDCLTTQMFKYNGFVTLDYANVPEVRLHVFNGREKGIYQNHYRSVFSVAILSEQVV